ncbi:adenosine deaminase, partial [Fusarium albosuccineum]
LLADVLKEEVPKIQASGLTFYGVRHEPSILHHTNKSAVAFDLQGQEDAGHPLLYWVTELLDMRARIRRLGLDLPFVFHAGETHDHGDDTDSNLFDAIMLGTKRIGHGFSVVKHPLLMELCKQKNIAIETCPISNEVLGLCPTIKAHHLPILLSNCVPCTINSDDPGSWGQHMKLTMRKGKSSLSRLLSILGGD